jgi:hypothetical protein
MEETLSYIYAVLSFLLGFYIYLIMVRRAEVHRQLSGKEP